MGIIVAIFIFGLIIGSFLSVCIYRLPFGRVEEEEDTDGQTEQQPFPQPKTPAQPISITYPPRSFCPECNAQLRWWHNIPLVSWLMLGGKCAFCKTTISVRYPLLEIMTAVVALLCYDKFGLTPSGVVIFAYCCALIVISFIDYDYYIIPNVISLPGAALGLALGLVNHYYHIFVPPFSQTLLSSVGGLLLGGGFLLLIAEGYLYLRKKEGLGFGDVKLLAMTGAFFGIEGAAYTIFVGSLVGAVLGLTLILIAGRKFSQHLPFGPYLALANFVFIFWGHHFLGPLG